MILNRLIIILMLVLVSCNIYMDYTFIKVGWCESEIDIMRNTIAEIHTLVSE